MQGPPPPAFYAPPATDPAAPPPLAQKDTLGWALVVTPIVSGAIYVGASYVVHQPTYLLYAGLFATDILIAVDAHRWKQKPAGWFLGAILLFAVAYPLYLWKRGKWGAPSRLAFGIVSLVLWLGSSAAGAMLHPPYALVRCAANTKYLRDGYACTVTETTGEAALNVCWDLVVECENGTSLRDHACVNVDANGSEKKTVGVGVFNDGACDKGKGARVENIVANEH